MSVASVPRNGHPCPKPEDQWTWLLNRTCLPGDTVIDPFVGSGATLRCAKDNGMNAIGIEIEEKYCEIAAKRLAQDSLFRASNKQSKVQPKLPFLT
jgi:DNA modification methylase